MPLLEVASRWGPRERRMLTELWTAVAWCEAPGQGRGLESEASHDEHQPAVTDSEPAVVVTDDGRPPVCSRTRHGTATRDSRATQGLRARLRCTVVDVGESLV